MLRAGQVVQLTEDHSLVNELIRRGRVTKEGFETSPYKAYKNAVTRAVGVYETVQGDTIDFEILPGDQFLLCSDGLHAYLNDARIIDIAQGRRRQGAPQEARRPGQRRRRPRQHHGRRRPRREGPRPSPGRPADDRAEELARKVDVLRRMPLFRHLVYKEILRLLNVTSVQGVRAGRGDHQGGDDRATRCSCSCAARSGCTRTTRSSPTSSPARTSGRWRSSTAATRGRPARPPRSGRACSSLTRKDFYEIIRKEPQLSTKLLWAFTQVLADRLRKTTAELSGARLEAGAEDLTADVLFEE